MERIFQYSLFAFTSIFTMVNPLGVIPIFSTLTASMSSKEARKIARKSVLTAFLVAVLFAIAGKLIFDLFHIEVNGLKVVGGILFFLSGYDMLNAKLSRINESIQNYTEFVNDFAITPLGIPMISGPGTMTVTLVLFNDAGNITEKLILLWIIIIIFIITYIMLLGSRKILRLIGDNGNKVLMRIMGLIVMVIAVELMLGGLKPIIRDILQIK
jgi:multiple antibiotic resistance protein